MHTAHAQPFAPQVEGKGVKVRLAHCLIVAQKKSVEDSESSVLVATRDHAVSQLEHCTLHWLQPEPGAGVEAAAGSKQAEASGHKHRHRPKPPMLVHVSSVASSRVSLSRCLLTSHGALLGHGVYALRDSSVLMQRSRLEECCISLEQGCSLVASRLHARGRNLLAARYGVGQDHASSSGTSGDGGSDEGGKEGSGNGSKSGSQEDEGCKDERCECCKCGHVLTTGLTVKGGSTCRLSSCHISGYDIGIQVGVMACGCHACAFVGPRSLHAGLNFCHQAAAGMRLQSIITFAYKRPWLQTHGSTGGRGSRRGR